jgi:ubiquinone/menaquinone biosynthesis C-methylase UbiE
VNVFNEMAEVYQQKYMNVDKYEESLNYLITNLSPKAAILDLACGPGNILNYLNKKNSKFTLEGIDLSYEMIKLAKLNVPGAKLEVSDCRNLDHTKRTYNAIVCSFLIPYLTEIEIEILLAQVSNLLVPNGIFYLGFITHEENSSDIQKSSKGHNLKMHYYSVDFVSRVLQNNNFILRHSKSYVSSNINQEQNDYIIVASK